MTLVIKDNPILQKAHSEYKRFTADEKMQMVCLDREKAEHDRVSLLQEAETRGEKRGEKRGAEKERSKFEKERIQEKSDTVKKMLSDGMDIQIISRYTGLSKEEIESLR